MSKIDNRLKKLIIRKCGLIFIIFTFTLISFYNRDENKLYEKKVIKKDEKYLLKQDAIGNDDENSFYFLTGEQRATEEEPGLGAIEYKLRNPLNAKVQNLIKLDQSLLRSNLKNKFNRIHSLKKQVKNNFVLRKNSQLLFRNQPNHRLRFRREVENAFEDRKNEKKQPISNEKDEEEEEEKENEKQDKNEINKQAQNKENEKEEKNYNKITANNDHQAKTNLKEDEKINKNNEEKLNEDQSTKDEETEDQDAVEENEDLNEENKEINQNQGKKINHNKNQIIDEINEKIKPDEKNHEDQKTELRNKLHKKLKNRKLRLNANNEVCTPAAYNEFPPDIFGQKLRSRGFILVHIIVVCYMFFCLAIVCDQFFLPSLELCAEKLHLSNDVAGATLMAAGSSAPELFIALLGVFIAKSDVGTGTIVGSAVFNIFFVIGLCAVCSASVQLSWWPVARDSTYYCLTVIVLIIVAYNGQITTLESSIMLLLYVGYILTMQYNSFIYERVLRFLNKYSTTSEFAEKMIKLDADLAQNKLNTKNSAYYLSFEEEANLPSINNTLLSSQDPHKLSMYESANYIIIQHKRLFRPYLRFQSAANLTLARNRKIRFAKLNQITRTLSRQESVLSQFNKRKVSLTEEVEVYWKTVPNYKEVGPLAYFKWMAMMPLYFVLYYTVPNCKKNQSMFMITFLVSITWIALFSYIMVWMVTVIGYTFGIPDAIMGITLLAAGTSVPDAYSSLHVAKQGEGDMAVSNSIGSNVFDILVGLALPWFIETTIVYPGTEAYINSRGLFYAIILLFLSLIITVYLFHLNNWILNKKLGWTMIFAYFVILFMCGILEFNIIDVQNPLMCDD